MNNKLKNFFKKRFSSDFTQWKLTQLHKTETLFVCMFAIMHAVYIFPEFNNLLNRETIPDTYIFINVALMRVLPIIIVTIGYILYKKKILSVITYTHLNNFAMLLVVIFTGISKYYVPKPNNPLGSILLDSVGVLMATIFSSSMFSIFNFIICFLTIFLMGRILPETRYVVRDIITSLIPFGVGMCILVFSLDNYFKKMYIYIQKIKAMSVEDCLTGLYNRNILKEKVYDKVTERCLYSGAMLMLDIDHFKKVNDEYGHQTGDVLLCRLAAILNENVRKEDYIVRFGGEEFLIVFKELSLPDVISIAERIRKQVESAEYMPSFTISCGVSPFYEGNRFETVTKIADDKLYEAKRTGRNKTCY